MIAALVGCGSWGERVARRLDEFDDVTMSAVFDADHAAAARLADELGTTALRDFTQYLDVMTPDAVVLAVPPSMRIAYVRAVCGQQRTRKQRIRIEKPLGGSLAEAHEIEQLCADAGVDLTVGFTLLHHPLYDAVFEVLDALDEDVRQFSALRMGRAPRHAATPQLDIGIHAASIAAYIGASPGRSTLLVGHHSHAAARTTTITTYSGVEIVVDEIALEARTPFGTIHVGDAHDALGADLRAWIDGTHRGTPDVALRAQAMVEHTLAGEWVAA